MYPARGTVIDDKSNSSGVIFGTKALLGCKFAELSFSQRTCVQYIYVLKHPLNLAEFFELTNQMTILKLILVFQTLKRSTKFKILF